MPRHALGIPLTVALLFAFAASARAGTLYVASNGLDAGDCGPKKSPCRSITRAIANASVGDKIIVGPGRYGDLNRNGTLGETGEETPSSGCGCMLSINKRVSVTSSNGAAVTVIDATSSPEATNVLIIATGGELGKPSKGFTVTNTGATSGSGIVIDAANVIVRGNQVVATVRGGSSFIGINALDDGPGPALIEANQIIGWTNGIRAFGAGKTVRKNVSVLNTFGIFATGSTNVVGNVVIGSFAGGLELADAVNVVGNAVIANKGAGGMRTAKAFGGVIAGNNVFGNFGPQDSNCGLFNVENGATNLVAANNYWGAATGPGPDPADDVCEQPTTATPFATKPFNVKAPIKP
jgi:hypothetical protein